LQRNSRGTSHLHICFNEQGNLFNWGGQPEALLEEACSLLLVLVCWVYIEAITHIRSSSLAKVTLIHLPQLPTRTRISEVPVAALKPPQYSFCTKRLHSMDSNRLQEVQQVQDALRKSEAQEAVSTLMDGLLHWSLNPTISGIIFRVASIYRMLMGKKSTANGIGLFVPSCNLEWAIDVIKKVSKTMVFDASGHELPVTIPLTNLLKAICNAFGCLISITLLATENKELKLRKSEMIGALEESEEWLDVEKGTNIACTRFRFLTCLY
jgi:hypothetical protein